MMFSRKRVATTCVVVFLMLGSLAYMASFTAIGKTSASQSSADPQVLQSLLTEVRELRLALQRSNLTTFRTQVALERMRLQMERVKDLRESLDRTREELVNEKSSRLSMADRMKDLEGRISVERDELKRAELNAEQIELKNALTQSGYREDQLREKENRLSAVLQDEQTKLDDISKKLEAMERKLETQEEDTIRQNKR
jgi:hypothetical protein